MPAKLERTATPEHTQRPALKAKQAQCEQREPYSRFQPK
jgi:hypothetical protein